MDVRNNKSIKILIHWPRFGPYHIARLNAAHDHLLSYNIQVTGMEIASQDETYRWSISENESRFDHRVVFPHKVVEKIRCVEIYRGVFSALGEIRPDVIAVNGYSTSDAWAIFLWSKLNRRKTILMMDSKADDGPRLFVKEILKKTFIRNYDASICGGQLHKSYLVQLGMNMDKIFMGYDVVDNNYFYQQAAIIRKDPSNYHNLPGLDSSTPCFLASSRLIPRKNIAGLLDSYRIYQELVAQSEQSGIPWRLVILGDGAERKNLEIKINAEALSGVTLAGHREIGELPAYYAHSSVFIHPALNDQWGLVVNEAMASGLPVLVSKRCGCVPELVRSAENGFVFDPENTRELAELMFYVSSHQINLGAMGQSSLEIISEWGTERFAKGILDSINTMMS